MSTNYVKNVKTLHSHLRLILVLVLMNALNLKNYTCLMENSTFALRVYEERKMKREII